MIHQEIPKLFYKLFKWLCMDEFFEELQGDLEEAFIRNLKAHGRKKARNRYKIEVLKMIRPSVIKPFPNFRVSSNQLIGNYVMTSIRAVKHNPFYISVNILSLAIALSICTIGYFNYRFNDTFNHYFEANESLYKVHGTRMDQPAIGSSPVALATNLEAAGIQAIRYHSEYIPLKINDKLFKEKTSFIDPGFLKHFPLENLEGRSISLATNNEVLISESTAMKLFGDEYPIGKIVNLIFPNQKEVSFKIRDVFVDPPKNISFHFSIITSFKSYTSLYDINEQDWAHWVDATFIDLENKSSKSIQPQLDQIISVQNYQNSGLEISGYELVNILDWPNVESKLHQSHFNIPLHPASVIGTASSAFAILLLACFNFINTSIALSGRRLKEIAIRKVMGGNRASTIVQFMVENMILILFAVMLSMVISRFLIPAYNSMYNLELIQLDKIPFQTFIGFGITVTILVSLIAAAYPSLYVSKFPSVTIFRDKVKLSGKNKLMVVLLTFQFAICFYNIYGLLLIIDNANYQETLDRGYAVKQTINVPLNKPEQYSIFKNEITKNPKIEMVSGSVDLIGFTHDEKIVEHNSNEYPIASLKVGKEYLETLKIRLSKGSLFIGQSSKSNKQIVINQMLEDLFGQDMLGQSILIDGEKYTVNGVVNDFNLHNIMFDNKIRPTAIQLIDEELYRYACVQAKEASLHDINTYLEVQWYNLFPQELYRGFFQKDVLTSSNQTNEIMIQINIFMAIISITISMLGLYTLVSLIAQRKSKEFGIRKVLGASHEVISHLLSKDLYWIIFLGGIIGLTGSYYVMDLIFDIIYAYHVQIEFIHFIWPTLIILATVIVTIGYKVIQTAKLNPVEQLRDE